MLFGGTFDPVHNAHLAVARATLLRFQPRRILFVPAARPPHKEGGAHASFEDRLRKVNFLSTGECISYGEAEARGIVISLLVDDGVPSRGHRKIILDPKFSAVGISAGKHVVYSAMCTLDFGGTPGRR